jgi:AraC family transcriptional regulator, regulatory protein of adaptative response / methylated-DNA-[protein]-cysteine methyltransferase
MTSTLMTEPAPSIPPPPQAPASRTLPDRGEMYGALVDRNPAYDGIFVVGVTTTGIFCRPSCPARKPKPENAEFYPGSADALAHGFRPCKRCRPMERLGETPEPVQALLREIEGDPSLRLRDRDLRARGLDPATIRRWFKRHHGMTFHAYQRARRMASAIRHLGDGARITDTAFDHGYESLSGFQEALQRIIGRSASRTRGAPVVHLTRILTPLGPMLAGARDEGVCLLEFVDRRMLETQLRRLARRMDAIFLPGESAPLQALREELDAYFQGRLRTFSTPVATSGTPFQEAVWSALRQVPYGTTVSYAEQARRIGRPSAVRAVARANGDNRISIVIPCHRVIGKDGSLTGYGGGLWRKRWMLELERGAVGTGGPSASPELGPTLTPTRGFRCPGSG